jgi:hypothetical protein
MPVRPSSSDVLRSGPGRFSGSRLRHMTQERVRCQLGDHARGKTLIGPAKATSGRPRDLWDVIRGRDRMADG